MRNIVKSGVKSYGSAKSVVALWAVSAVLPVALVPTKQHGFQLLNAGAIVVLGLLVFFLAKYVRKRIAAEQWVLSDSVVYIVAPALIFVWCTAMMLSSLFRA